MKHTWKKENTGKEKKKQRGKTWQVMKKGQQLSILNIFKNSRLLFSLF